MGDAGSSAKRWDALRRSLRVCHDAIDASLNELHDIQRLAGSAGQRPRGEPAPADVESQTVRTADVAKTIRENLRQANHLVNDLASLSAGDSVKMAQLQRLEAITSNYSKEFEQTYGSITQTLERKRLLKRSRAQQTAIGQATGDLPAGAVEQHTLLQEKRGIDASMSLLDQAVSIGREALASLGRQRGRLDDTRGLLHQFTNKMPHVRTLMSRIQRAKVKQAVILATVVGLCLLFLLQYMFRV